MDLTLDCLETHVTTRALRNLLDLLTDIQDTPDDALEVIAIEAVLKQIEDQI